MPQQLITTLENNFSGGLKTEFNVLNPPENSCIDMDNCDVSRYGNISRRPGIDYETGFSFSLNTDGSNRAICGYIWNNVGGDGVTKMLVQQVGNFLFFYRFSDMNSSTSLSDTKIGSFINLESFQIDTYSGLVEVQFAQGNGYLFVFHPNIKPIYCSYSGGVVTAQPISIQIRDFLGVPEPNVSTQLRPASLSDSHSYNITNQGWSSQPAWSATSSSSVAVGTGSKVYTVASGLPISGGQQVQATGSFVEGGSTSYVYMSGTVTSYVGTTLTLNITSSSNNSGFQLTNWSIVPINLGLINTWFTAEGNYPSNADVWWRFKDSTGVFNPATMQPNVTLGTGPANKGFYIIDAFHQNRSATSSIPNITNINTNIRPKTGTWFQGRVWYAGTDASQAATGTAPNYTWSETIYFSQVAEGTSQFGMCYQNNDPTSEEFFDLLPTDGGTITIQGAGSVYKLFPIQNGLLVFAGNGIWFITGSQGIGFAANDYTVTKISSIPTISGSSFIDVQGYPVFWNEEGIYAVLPSQQGGGLTVSNLCEGTIQQFYNSIPSSSKKYVHGDYDPLNYQIAWLFRDTEAQGISQRYSYNRILKYDTQSKAFVPYTISNPYHHIHDVKFITVSGATDVDPTFKYFSSMFINAFTYSEENDVTTWTDFASSVSNRSSTYDSYFITTYKIHSKAITKFSPIYIQTYSRSEVPTAFKIQGIWDFANSPNSGKYTSIQQVTNAVSRFGITKRRHRIRGSGVSLQFKVMSVPGLPFDLVGWSTYEAVNQGV